MAKLTSSRAREKLYDRCRIRDAAGKLEDHPRCNIPGCGMLVTPGQRWVESHYPVMKANGGEITGIAHHRCNFLFWCEIEAPALARAKRARQRHIGARMARMRPMPGSRATAWRRRMNGTVERRGG